MAPVSAWPALALLIGTACGVFLDLSISSYLTLLATGWGTALVALWRDWSTVASIALVCGLGGAGALRGMADARAALDPPILNAWRSSVDGVPLQLEGRLKEDAVPTEYGASLALDVDRVWTANGARPSSGGVRLSVSGALVDRHIGAWRLGRGVRVQATLRRPQPYRNFGVPDQEERLALRGVRLIGSVKSAALVHVSARARWWQEVAGAVRAAIRRVIADAIGRRDPQAAAIVTAVLIGDRAGLSTDVEASLQRAGTFHVIAISGGNIAVLAALVVALLSTAGLPPRCRAWLTITVLAGYWCVVTASPSVARATVAALIYLAARGFDLQTAPTHALAVTASLLVAWRPLALMDAGFWLTVLASLAIIEHAPAVAARLRRSMHRIRIPTTWLQPALLLLAATIVAEGVVTPVTAHAFSQVTAAGLFLNFIAVPLMAIVQIAGMALAATSLVHPWLAATPAAVATIAARLLVDSAALVDMAPWLARRVAPPPLWLVLMATSAWWLTFTAARTSQRWFAALVWCSSLAIVLAQPVLPSVPATLMARPPCMLPTDLHHPADGDLHVIVLDVAQGDATVVRFPDDSTMLVDAGGSSGRFDVGARVVSPALWALGRRGLGVLLVTHPDMDHIGGGPAVVEDFRPMEVWEGIPVMQHPLLTRLKQRADANSAGWRRRHAGDRFERGRAELRVWHPPIPSWQRRRARNDDSMVIDLQLGDVQVVLPGDIGAGIEQHMAASLKPARLLVLKAPHHGSRQSSSVRFVRALAPDVVIFSAGRDNRYGHPSPDVVARYASAGARIYRTDLDGAVHISTNGKVLRVVTCEGSRSAEFR